MTGTEIDNAGFNLYRATAVEGPYVKLNESLIPASGTPTEGSSYSYLDTVAIDPNIIYYYKLEDVDFNGISTFHGPVNTGPWTIESIYLPLIVKETAE